jgi:hypothetical protein
VGRFGQNSQAAGTDPYKNLEASNGQSRQQRIAGSFTLLCAHQLGSYGDWHAWHMRIIAVQQSSAK